MSRRSSPWRRPSRLRDRRHAPGPAPVCGDRRRGPGRVYVMAAGPGRPTPVPSARAGYYEKRGWDRAADLAHVLLAQQTLSRDTARPSRYAGTLLLCQSPPNPVPHPPTPLTAGCRLRRALVDAGSTTPMSPCVEQLDRHLSSGKLRRFSPIPIAS